MTKIFLIMLNLSIMTLLQAKNSQNKYKTVDKIDSNMHNKKSILRVGGLYKVQKIKKIAKGMFFVSFVSSQKTGRFDTLNIYSNNVHVSLQKNKQFRLSAEIIKEKGNVAEIGQVVIFLPSLKGQIPVWMLSVNNKNSDLVSTSYLKMHVPLSDYWIL